MISYNYRGYAVRHQRTMGCSPHLESLSLDSLFVSPARRPDPRPQNCHETINCYPWNQAYVAMEKDGGMSKQGHVNLYTSSGTSARLQGLSATTGGAGEGNDTGRAGWLVQSLASIPAIESNKSI